MGFLDYDRSVAKAGYNRWLVPPAALAVHLSIGQVYAFSVFKIPLTHLIGITKQVPGQDWEQTQLAWIFSIAIVFLGLSAAVFGKWLERAGPRKAMFMAALCFGSGFFVSALGVQLHQLWLLYLGYGVIGGDRAGARIYLARLNPHQMVHRSTRYGDRYGDHGIRRWGDDRWSARGFPDAPFQDCR